MKYKLVWILNFFFKQSIYFFVQYLVKSGTQENLTEHLMSDNIFIILPTEPKPSVVVITDWGCEDVYEFPCSLYRKGTQELDVQQKLHN